jgi:ribosomal 50S subunit-associated protein YjgA (DUF615 family)
MAVKKTFPDPDAQQLEHLIRAGINDLSRITAGEVTGTTDTSRLQAVPRAAQLSMFLLLLTKGVERKHRIVFTHKERLEGYLGRVYRKSKACWEEAIGTKSEQTRSKRLQDTRSIEPAISALDRFAEKSFGAFGASLAEFGVADVQTALGALTTKLADGVRQDLQLADRGKKSPSPRFRDKPPEAYHEVPPQVLGGLLAASLAGDVAAQGKISPEQAKAMRVAVFIGTDRPDPATPKLRGTKKLTKTLEGLAHHIRSLKN